MNNYLHLENCQEWNKIWIMFDLSNGHKGGRTYFWVFPTKKQALEHRKNQHKMEFGAKLSHPILVKQQIMKQYLLIDIEALKECNNEEYYHLGWLKSKGQIVEIKNKSLNELFKEYCHSNTKQTFESFVVNQKGYKLIKEVK